MKSITSRYEREINLIKEADGDLTVEVVFERQRRLRSRSRITRDCRLGTRTTLLVNMISTILLNMTSSPTGVKLRVGAHKTGALGYRREKSL
jgi:hypothetical protein